MTVKIEESAAERRIAKSALSYEGPEGKVYSPTSHEQAKALGRGTKWGFAHPDGAKTFDAYKDGLKIIHTADGKRYATSKAAGGYFDHNDVRVSSDPFKWMKEEAQMTSAGQTLQTKSAMMSGVLAAMSSMSHEDMMKWFPDAMELANTIAPQSAQQNASTLQMKPSAAVGGAVKEDALQLFSGEELNEAAQDKIVTLIEHAVDLRVGVEIQRLEEEFQTKLVEETVKIQDDLVEKIDSYATYAAEEWVEKNQVAVESAIRTEKAERLIEGLKALMAECYVEIPEDKVDFAESLEEELKTAKDKLNEQVEEIVHLREHLMAANAMEIFREVSEGLTPIEVGKFKQLIEDVDVVEDMDVLKRKLTVIKEAHFKNAPKTVAKTGIDEAVDISDDNEPSQKQQISEVHDPRIKAYADAISRASNKFARGPFTS